jgi:hypothetical protein
VLGSGCGFTGDEWVVGGRAGLVCAMSHGRGSEAWLRVGVPGKGPDNMCPASSLCAGAGDDFLVQTRAGGPLRGR